MNPWIFLAAVLALLIIPIGASAIPCTQASDCGLERDVGYPFCQGGNLVLNRLSWSCVSSECSGSVGQAVVKACSSGCIDDLRYADLPSCIEDVNCSAVESQVCGEDNQTYVNECLLFKAGVEKKYDGACRVSNTPPEITVPEGSLIPLVGDVNTEFEFRAVYRDLDGDSPEYMKVRIGQDSYYMMKLRNETSSPKNGTEFYLSINLSAGLHSHKFIASDGEDINETELLDGPEVWSNRSIKNPGLSILNTIWSVSGLFSDSALILAFQNEINSFLRTCQIVNGTCRVPIKFTSESGGRLNLTSLRVFVYDKLEGDTNKDNKVNIFDLARVGLRYGSDMWGDNYDPRTDVNGDGIVNIFDLATVGLNYGKEVVCTPDCSCTENTCTGETCPDGCGGTCQGQESCLPSDWWNENWDHRKELNLTNLVNWELQNYSLNISLDTAGLIAQGEMQPDCGDIRILDSTLELEYGIGNCNSPDTEIYFRTDLTALGTEGLYIYYGNPGAVNGFVPNWKDVFYIWHDDFDTDRGWGNCPGNTRPGTVTVDTANSWLYASYGTYNDYYACPADGSLFPMDQRPGFRADIRIMAENDRLCQIGVILGNNSGSQITVLDFRVGHNDYIVLWSPSVLKTLDDDVWYEATAVYSRLNGSWYGEFANDGLISGVRAPQAGDDFSRVTLDICNNINMYLDYLYLRYYTEPEPSWTIS